MVLLLFFGVLALTVVWLVGPSRLARWMWENVHQAPVEAASSPVSAAPQPVPPEPARPATEEELMEQILTAERLAGILPSEDYQRGMAVLAAKDALSHPMVLPPERL